MKKNRQGSLNDFSNISHIYSQRLYFHQKWQAYDCQYAVHKRIPHLPLHEQARYKTFLVGHALIPNFIQIQRRNTASANDENAYATQTQIGRQPFFCIRQ